MVDMPCVCVCVCVCCVVRHGMEQADITEHYYYSEFDLYLNFQILAL